MSADTATVLIHTRPVRMWIPKALGYVPWTWLKFLLCRTFLRFSGMDVKIGESTTRIRLSLEMLEKRGILPSKGGA